MWRRLPLYYSDQSVAMTAGQGGFYPKMMIMPYSEEGKLYYVYVSGILPPPIGVMISCLLQNFITEWHNFVNPGIISCSSTVAPWGPSLNQSGCY